MPTVQNPQWRRHYSLPPQRKHVTGTCIVRRQDGRKQAGQQHDSQQFFGPRPHVGVHQVEEQLAQIVGRCVVQVVDVVHAERSDGHPGGDRIEHPDDRHSSVGRTWDASAGIRGFLRVEGG